MLDALVTRLWRRRQFKMVRNTPSLAGGDLGSPHGDFGDDTLKCAFGALALECALPYDYHVPSRFAPSLLVAVVALDVLRPLLRPERDIGLRHGRILAAVPVPETAAHVDNRLSLENDNIRLARIALVAHLEPPTLRKQPLADKKLGLRVLTANPRHQFSSLFWRYAVHQGEVRCLASVRLGIVDTDFGKRGNDWRSGDLTAAFARCCFCIADNRLVFTRPISFIQFCVLLGPPRRVL